MGDKDVWLGIDVAKGTFHAALACGEVPPRAWPKFAHAEFPHTELGMRRLLRWLGGQGVSPLGLGGVCVEATGRLGTRWRDMAGERVTPVSVVNPGCVHAFSRSMGLRDKTDRVDACVIALFGRVMRPRPTPAPVPEERALRELGRVHRALLCERLAWEQRLKDGPGTPLVRQMCAEMIRSIGGRLRRVERRMDEVVCSHSRLAGDYARLVGVKGIGRRTALSLLGEFGDLRQYKRGELVALAGLCPREYSSGTSVRRPARLAKSGRGGVRAALYMAAMSASRSNPQIRAFAERLKARGKKPMQVLCAVMRKLLLMARAVVVGDREYSPHYPGGAACVAPPAPDMIPDARSEDRATPEGDPSAATGPKTQGWGADTFHAPSHPPLRIGRNAVNSGGLGAKPPRTRPKDAVPTRQKRAGKTVQKT